MEAIRAAGCGRNLKQVCLRNCQINTACTGVGGILIEGNKQIIAVIAPVQEYANERSIVGGGLRCKRMNDAEALDAGSQCHTAERARAVAKEISACGCHSFISVCRTAKKLPPDKLLSALACERSSRLNSECFL